MTQKKTLKEFVEVYTPKAEGEKDFADKHVVNKQKEREGNKDEIYTASNVKTVDRKKNKQGYNPGEDEKVYS